MDRLGKWIRRRQSYSNPLFGTMVILMGMVFPVFHASAAIEEPVQPMAQTADQVVDALKAIDGGATVEQAFFEQPLPYREFLRFQNQIYQDLFDQERPLGGDSFLVGQEIGAATNTFVFQCQTAEGLDYELEVVQLYSPSSDYGDFSSEEILIYESVDDNSLGVVGALRVGSAELYFSGVILQMNHLGIRLNELLVLSEMDSGSYGYLKDIRDQYGVDYYTWLSAASPPPGDIGGPVSGYPSCVSRARIIFDGELNGNQIVFGTGLAILTLGVAVAAAICLSTIAVPIIGWLFSGGCAIKAAAEAALGLVGLAGNLALQNGLAANRFNTAKNLCCFDWPDTCPGDPV